MDEIPELKLWMEMQVDDPLMRQRAEFKIQVLIYQQLEKNGEMLKRNGDRLRDMHGTMETIQGYMNEDRKLNN
jgi:hypothetical protein